VLQQTILHAVIESFPVGVRFNDTLPMGFSESTTHELQVAHSPVAGGRGVAFGGGAQPGTLGIAGGTFPTLGTYGNKSQLGGSLFFDPFV